jgi:hypothetical protein
MFVKILPFSRINIKKNTARAGATLTTCIKKKNYQGHILMTTTNAKETTYMRLSIIVAREAREEQRKKVDIWAALV